jgi:hypothetical protein
MKSLKALLSEIRAELSSIGQKIKESGTSITDERIAHNESEQKGNEKISHAIHKLTDQKNQSDNTAETNQDRRHRQNRIPQWITALATCLAFIAAAIYAGIAACQWSTMRETYGEIQKQTSQIQKQTDLLHKQVVGTQRAIIRLKMGYPSLSGPDGIVMWEFVNTGVVPGKNLSIHGTVSYIDISTEKTDGSGPPIEKVLPFIPHTDNPDIVASGGPGEISWFPHLAFVAGSRKLERFENTELAVLINADISYDDGFDEIEKLPSVCDYFFGYYLPGQKAPETTSAQCDSFPSFSILKQRVLSDIRQRQRPN